MISLLCSKFSSGLLAMEVLHCSKLPQKGGLQELWIADSFPLSYLPSSSPAICQSVLGNCCAVMAGHFWPKQDSFLERPGAGQDFLRARLLSEDVSNGQNCIQVEVFYSLPLFFLTLLFIIHRYCTQ